MADKCDPKELTTKLRDIEVSGLLSSGEVESAIQRQIIVQIREHRKALNMQCSGRCDRVESGFLGEPACVATVALSQAANKLVMEKAVVSYYLGGSKTEEKIDKFDFDVEFKVRVPLTNLDPRVEITSRCDCVVLDGPKKPVQKKKYSTPF